MLDYAPQISTRTGIASPYARKWAYDIALPLLSTDTGLAPDPALSANSGNAAPATIRPAGYPFQPERTSGFCASS